MPVPFDIRPVLVRFRPSLVAAVHGDAETPDTHGGDGRGDGGNGGGESRGAGDVEAGFGDGEAGFGDGEARRLVFGHGGEDHRAPRRHDRIEAGLRDPEPCGNLLPCN